MELTIVYLHTRRQTGQILAPLSRVSRQIGLRSFKYGNCFKLSHLYKASNRGSFRSNTQAPGQKSVGQRGYCAQGSLNPHSILEQVYLWAYVCINEQFESTTCLEQCTVFVCCNHLNKFDIMTLYIQKHKQEK